MHKGREGVGVLNEVEHVRLGRQIPPGLPKTNVCRNIAGKKLGHDSKVHHFSGGILPAQKVYQDGDVGVDNGLKVNTASRGKGIGDLGLSCVVARRVGLGEEVVAVGVEAHAFVPSAATIARPQAVDVPDGIRIMNQELVGSDANNGAVPPRGLDCDPMHLTGSHLEKDPGV